MMESLVKLATWKARLAVAASLIASLVALRACDVSKQRRIGEERHAQKVEAAANANAKTADKVRNSISDVPAERLRDKWTRD